MAEQMKLSFLATTASKIDELPIVDGQFILIKDINTIAVDMNDKRTKYEQIITLASDSDRSSILAPVNGVFYFVVETNSLWKYDQGWKMICSAQSAIPTGGSNGQILKKKSNRDYDVGWQDDTGGSVGVEYDAEKQAIVFENGGGTNESINIDPTLSNTGEAADAKATVADYVTKVVGSGGADVAGQIDAALAEAKEYTDQSLTITEF